MKYELKYKEKRKTKSVMLEITDINNWSSREYQAIFKQATDASSLYKKIKRINEDRGAVLFEGTQGSKDWKQRMEKLDKELSEIEKKLENFDSDNYFKRRFNLIQEILEFNDIEHEFLYDFDFWDRKVSPDVIMEFLDKSVHCRLEDKKQGKQKEGAPKK